MKNRYLKEEKNSFFPRIPVEGYIDLTYQCNNNCRHCWSRISPDEQNENKELSFKEIKKLVDDSREMGCQKWGISGGEPMMHPDFLEIFNYITSCFMTYKINTNGTLITPEIAKLLKRKGSKMIALYGATAKVHDHITRNPGSFELTMRGFRYLKEVGASFIVQLVPMRDNYHQFTNMMKLAESLSKYYRVGASWLYLSAYGDEQKNQEIRKQRLSPKEVVEIAGIGVSDNIEGEKIKSGISNTNKNDYLFASCIDSRRSFHIDAYGNMTFCSFIKNSELRYDLKKGSFKECWENFISSLSNKIKVTKEYKENCGSCELKKYCRICPVYGYLENQNFNSKVDYLCAIAKENYKFKQSWLKNHRRYFKIAGITIQIESDLPIKENTFHERFKVFEVDKPGDDMVFIKLHFFLPDLEGKNLGRQFYYKPPWVIYKRKNSWIYRGITSIEGNNALRRMAVFNYDHTRARLYRYKKEDFLKGGLNSLTVMFSDQTLLAHILAHREGCYLHSCGVDFQGEGLLFVGHSTAGKSTIANIIRDRAEILCDDRIIIRKQKTDKPGSSNNFKIYGTWSHGTVSDISPRSAPLKAILFLKKSKQNQLIPLKEKKEVVKGLLAHIIRPFITVDWWKKNISLIEEISDKIPCYLLKFNKSDKLIKLLDKL